jgi:anhydro-N-acetylmuramic acid kinase
MNHPLRRRFMRSRIAAEARTPVAERFLGLISGTSADGVDAVLASFDEHRCTVHRGATTPLPPALADRLRRVLHNPTVTLPELGTLDVALGRFFAECALAVLDAAECRPADVIAIGHHGQSVFHDPQGDEPFTMQIGDPNVIAAHTGITTVADFRRLDVALGGQGAPLVPAFHAWCFADPHECRAVVNIGGIANVTRLATGAPVTGFDTGPGNTLLDHWVRRQRGESFDAAGAWAAGGSVNNRLLTRLLADPYFSASPPKSTGPEYFSPAWLDARLDPRSESARPADIQATLSELTAVTISRALTEQDQRPDRVLVCGGGVHNADLLERIRRHMAPVPVIDTSWGGVDPDWVEGAAFAWLARQRLRAAPGNVPSVTGARRAVTLGGVYSADYGHEHSHDQPGSKRGDADTGQRR